MADLKKLFVIVPSGTINGTTTIDTIKAKSADGKIYFVQDTNEIVAKGTAFGASSSAMSDISGALADIFTLSGKVATLNGDANTTGSVIKTVNDAIAAITTADAGAIDKLEEIIAWFAGVSATDSGSGAIKLITDVANLSGTVLSNYNALSGDLDSLSGIVAANKQEALSGKLEAKAYTDEKVSGAVASVNTLSGIVATNAEVTTTALTDLNDRIKAIETSTTAADGISALSGKLETLSGTVEANKNALSGAIDAAKKAATSTVASGDAEKVTVSGTVAADGHTDYTVSVKTSALGEVGLEKTISGWVAGTANTATGLATAADVAAELVADEEVIAAALNDHEDRINAIETYEAWETFSL